MLKNNGYDAEIGGGVIRESDWKKTLKASKKRLEKESQYTTS